MQHGILALHRYVGIGHVERSAALLPHLQAFRHTVAIVVVIGRTPEVGLQAKAFGEVFHAIHLVRGHQTARFVEDKPHFRGAY